MTRPEAGEAIGVAEAPLFDDATRPQVRAADPEHASWVSANAGSGKTKVLTDRVARLLLSGTPPQRILCLTFTTAAASNMQNRLFERLGEWSMLPEEPLANELLRLGEDPASLDRDRLRRARTLFARALETPGGLKIQTIHAFASSILKRFPLEAGVSPQFTSLDDRSARKLREEVLDSVATECPASFGAIARYLSIGSLPDLVEGIASNRSAFADDDPEERIGEHYLLNTPLAPVEDIVRRLLADDRIELIRYLVNLLSRGSTMDLRARDKLLLLNTDSPTLEDFRILESTFLYGPGATEPFTPKPDRFPTRDLQAQMVPMSQPLYDFMREIAAAREFVWGTEAARKTLALHEFAIDFLAEYERRKNENASLDFDDLILKTLMLLSNPETAQWVLYKLDGGIDHILVDEAQDVSRTQWSIITSLAEEFTAGAGVRDRDRTVFAVGDEKQSIYGFQGAAPEKFAEMRDHFRNRYRQAGIGFVESDLDYSFRSSPAILEVVDRVFEDRNEPGFAARTNHLAFKGDLPGRVDVWPVIEPSDRADRVEWYGAGLISQEMQAHVKLARFLALQIQRLVDPVNGEYIVAGDGPRPVRCGDILILVRRRNRLFHSIIAELKAVGLSVAGTDRMRLLESLAVQDVRAVLSFLATPGDDLSLAAALRSPIFRLTEEELFEVSQRERRVSLWESLEEREHEYSEAVAIIRDLQTQSERLKPFELIERLLTVHNGRELLTARLGHEVLEPLDALLHQALAYDEEEASSLTGFLEWSGADFEIKRQLDQAGDEIRVMTVHGAKGLESPVVILPDTSDRKVSRFFEGILIAEDGTPLWNVPEKTRPQTVEMAHEWNVEQQENEQLRLLYVAMTRAESWLIVAAAGTTGPESWHWLIQQGLEKCPCDPIGFPEQADADLQLGEFLRHSHGSWPTRGESHPEEEDLETILPKWVHEAPPDYKLPPPLRSPSGLGGSKQAAAGKDESSTTRNDAMVRGTMVHLLLEHLPETAETERPKRSMDILRCKHPEAGEELCQEVCKEAWRIIDNPELAFLFDEHTIPEVGISANLAGLGGDRILGYIDRLVVAPDRVIAVDFKSNMNVPVREADVPEHILRQMGAYHESLEQLYPGRAVELSILWTRTSELMNLDPALCKDALSRADADREVTDPDEFDEFGESFK